MVGKWEEEYRSVFSCQSFLSVLEIRPYIIASIIPLRVQKHKLSGSTNSEVTYNSERMFFLIGLVSAASLAASVDVEPLTSGLILCPGLFELFEPTLSPSSRNSSLEQLTGPARDALCKVQCITDYGKQRLRNGVGICIQHGPLCPS